jgi:deazaflavin-dependent oxidoreductase (nitroreductase family)
VARTYRPTLLRRALNLLLRPLIRLGLVPHTYLLTVRGRKTGRRYSTPVRLIEQDGEGMRWLVAPYGERSWVKNARAAGVVELSRGGRSERLRTVELPPAESAPILREYLRQVPITRRFFEATPDSPLEQFVAEAPRHPVFRLEPA